MKKILWVAMVLMAAAPALLAVGRGQRNVAILIFPGVQIIDYTGPYEVLGHASVNGQRAFQIYTVSETTDPITTAMGMTVIPAFTFDRAPKADVLVVPGGGVDPHLERPGLHALAPRERERRRGRPFGLQRRVLSGKGGAARRARGHDLRRPDRRAEDRRPRRRKSCRTAGSSTTGRS